MPPAVSVILPVFNAAPYVQKAVQSILEQSFKDFELLLLDDGSTDASREIVRALAGQDGRIRLVQRENKGLIATLNEGLSLSRAALIARMDADDISLPQRLELQCARMNADPKVVVLGGAIQYMNETGSIGRSVTYPMGQEVDSALLWGSPLAHPTTMLRTDVARRAGGYSTMFLYAEDYAFWLRLRNYGCIDNLPQTLLRYRVHRKSTSHIYACKQRTSTLRAQAFWLAEVHPTFSLMNIESNTDFLDALPLSPEVRIDILARMLALSPHLIGDEFADAETALWLNIVRRSVCTPIRRWGLACFHLRAAWLYRNELLRALFHLGRAALVCPSACLALLRKWRGEQRQPV